MISESQILRGEIYLADLSPAMGSEQGGTRPVLILQNDIGNCYSNTTIVAAITTHFKNKPHLPTHVMISMRDGLRYDSIVLLEQVRTIDKVRLIRKIGSLNYDELDMVNRCLKVSLGIAHSYI